MVGSVRIGCSGWIYAHWRGLFYPEKMPQKAWFGHYAATFDTVEINNSFYRLPKAETFDAWREQAGERLSSLRTFANIRMKPMNVFPMIILLIAIVLVIIWLRPH